MADLSAIWREDADEAEVIAAYQDMIDSGQAWRMEDSVGRTAMRMIEAGVCVLGEEPHRDYWGNRIPSRFEVAPGTKGSIEYAQRLTDWGD